MSSVLPTSANRHIPLTHLYQLLPTWTSVYSCETLPLNESCTTHNVKCFRFVPVDGAHAPGQLELNLGAVMLSHH
jgi:hypothetical protein